MLQAKARTLATNDYAPESGPQLPDSLKKLSYDDYQAIHFVPAQAPWAGERLKFTFQLFHRGFIYQEPVRVHLIEGGQVRDFPFAAGQFSYGRNKLTEKLPDNLHFAGLKVLFPLNAPDKQDEVASFLGASYFRLIGAHQGYGAACRGLAIDTAEPSGEEFPRFTEFWIEKPGALDTSMKLYALLDSPSAAGAYRFVIQPGEQTRVAVEASVFLRKPVKKLGVAPLTSMFLMGENRSRYVPDFRPEVHDSDGLLVRTATNHWLWRPLLNPEKTHTVSRFPQAGWKAFGLLQRDRNFDHYQDLVGRYELRPSLWVETEQDWGPGALELVEIPTPSEWNDNIVAYWTPQEKLERGQAMHWSYTVSACPIPLEDTNLLRVASTRIDPEQDKKPVRFVIDFHDSKPSALAADARIETSVQTSHGTIRNLVTEKNDVTGGWRTFFDLADAGKDPTDLRLFLHSGERILSETWLYRYQKP